MAYLPGGRQLVTGSEDKTIRIWRTADGSQDGPSLTHAGGVWHLSVTRDGRRIVSGDDGGRVNVWDVDSHELVEEWTDTENTPEFPFHQMIDSLLMARRPLSSAS